jgi:hypothetical protein
MNKSDMEASQTRDSCVANDATHRGSPRSLAAQRALARDDKRFLLQAVAFAHQALEAGFVEEVVG